MHAYMYVHVYTYMYIRTRIIIQIIIIQMYTVYIHVHVAPVQAFTLKIFAVTSFPSQKLCLYFLYGSLSLNKPRELASGQQKNCHVT